MRLLKKVSDRLAHIFGLQEWYGEKEEEKRNNRHKSQRSRPVRNSKPKTRKQR